MLISLGIESSCDDTCVAVVTNDRKILSNIVISQIEEHKKYQGVVPEIAARSHVQHIETALSQALCEANITLKDINIIAATAGPGLIGGVIVSTNFSKAIALVLKKFFIAVNHLEGHALTTRLTDNISFPYLLLLVSGGHCQFVAVLGLGQYKILGQTLDDSLGEAFDKTAKLLGLGYPGGPIIEKLAKNGDPCKYTLPLSMVTKDGCNLSFSGLKTAVKQLILNVENLDDQTINDICASFQYTVVKIIIARSINAIKMFNLITYSKYFVLSGGVAANLYLRSQLEIILKAYDFTLIAPPINLCTDNAAMIAWVGIEKYQNNITTSLDFVPKARWSLEDISF